MNDRIHARPDWIGDQVRNAEAFLYILDMATPEHLRSLAYAEQQISPVLQYLIPNSESNSTVLNTLIKQYQHHKNPMIHTTPYAEWEFRSYDNGIQFKSHLTDSQLRTTHQFTEGKTHLRFFFMLSNEQPTVNEMSTFVMGPFYQRVSGDFQEEYGKNDYTVVEDHNLMHISVPAQGITVPIKYLGNNQNIHIMGVFVGDPNQG